jgi:3-hydroxyacyl-[acyl-carrier-protein] dehydratase
MMTTLTNEPILQHASVSALIPQQPPVEMVDTLWLNDDTTTVSGFTIQSDNIFCKNGFFTEPGIIENIAQTAALRAGYMVSLLAKDGKLTGPPPVGYIAAIKNLNIYHLPQVGTDLKTEIIVKQVIFDVTLIAAKTTCNGELVADCEMKIFLKKP